MIRHVDGYQVMLNIISQAAKHVDLRDRAVTEGERLVFIISFCIYSSFICLNP